MSTIELRLADPAGLVQIAPDAVALPPPRAPAAVALRADVSGRTIVSIAASDPSDGAMGAFVLESGVGYSAGTLSLEGYPGGAGFAGAFDVGVAAWGVYGSAGGEATLQAARRGAGYRLFNATDFAGPYRGSDAAPGEPPPPLPPLVLIGHAASFTPY
jgi:hypothetical protein